MRVIRQQYHLHGGVHPPSCKDRTAALPIEPLPASILTAEPLFVSLHQNIGAPSKTIVAVGDHVLRGQLIADAGAFVGSVVHAPTSGTIRAIEPKMGPAGRTVFNAVLEADGEDRAADPMPPIDWSRADDAAIVERVKMAGVIGMGGAGFPNQVKISPPPGCRIDTVVLNGAECEPYLTCDHRLMVERAREIVEGALILHHVLGGPRIRIAVEENKPDAIAALSAIDVPPAVDAAIVSLAPSYPQGGEKQAVYTVTGREVPEGGLPAHVGCVVSNVGTVYAIWNAVVRGIPLYERVTTVTGPALASPRNVLARIGLSYRVLVEHCGGLASDVAKVLCGGPMMGFAQASLDMCIGKATSGVLALRAADVVPFESSPCIGCGRCNASCTLRLLPSEIALACEADDIDEAERLGVMDCCECGACAYACPARRPLVQHFRRVRGIIAARRKR